VGEDVQAPYLQKAVFWLLGHQNADGGFGEGTRSYEDAAWAGRGVSTPSQTAWALLALIETGLGHSPSAERAVDYLLREFEREGKWVDSSTVGTGHPRVVYLNYPSYPYAFPLQALARYLSH
jgi:squalene-hopene/tetraprenyl-beta-curcumene cyclase